MEIDTSYWQQYENYIGDIVSGRLSVDPARRDAGIESRLVIDDGVIRIGESSDRVGHAQAFLSERHYLDADNRALEVDGNLSPLDAGRGNQVSAGLRPSRDR